MNSDMQDIYTTPSPKKGTGKKAKALSKSQPSSQFMYDFDAASNPKRVDARAKDSMTRGKLMSLMEDVGKVTKVVQDLQPPSQSKYVKQKAGTIFKRQPMAIKLPTVVEEDQYSIDTPFEEIREMLIEEGVKQGSSRAFAAG